MRRLITAAAAVALRPRRRRGLAAPVPVAFQVEVADDHPVDCAAVTVTFVLGHDQHGHPLSTASGCSGSITTFLDEGHAGAENLTAVFVAEYTDAGGQTGSAQVVLTPGED